MLTVTGPAGAKIAVIEFSDCQCKLASRMEQLAKSALTCGRFSNIGQYVGYLTTKDIRAAAYAAGGCA